MNDGSNHYKSFLNGAGSTKDPEPSLLEKALNNSIRKRYGFNVLFADINKVPRRDWVKWQSQAQADDDVRALFATWKPDKVTCLVFVCGYKGLEAIDFDWPWVYRLWKAKFGVRAETLTVQTPNGGLRSHFICDKPETCDKFKESLHVELKGPGRFVVYEGKANKEDGSIGEYKVVIDKPVREDNSIIADTLAFLEETRKWYHFLFWNCLRPHFSKKRLNPTHNVRLFLADVMMSDGFSHEEIVNLFRDFENFDSAKTEYQVSYTKRRIGSGLKPPTCETLREMLGWSEQNCGGCPRRGKNNP